MQKFYTNRPYWVFLKCLLLIQCFFWASAARVYAQKQQADSNHLYADTIKFTPVKYTVDASEINSFQNLNVPLEMVRHLQGLTPEQAIALHDEFQITTGGENDDEQIITIKLWFKNDHIIGYIYSAPIAHTSSIEISKKYINVPVQWRCTSYQKKHGQHVANNLNEIAANESEYNCHDWYMLLPPFPPLPPTLPVKAEKKKKIKQIQQEHTQTVAAVN